MRFVERRDGAPRGLWLLGGSISIAVLLTVAYLFAWKMVGRSTQFIDLNREANLPAWWSGSQLLVAGLFFLLVSFRTIFIARAAPLLGAFGLLLATLSLDEIASVHEQVGFLLDRMLLHREDTTFGRTGIWFVVVGAPFVVLLVFMLKSLYAFLGVVPGTIQRISLGFAVLLSGAIGVEAFSSFIGDESYHLSIATEELLEMVGGSILLWAGFVFACSHPSTRPFRQLMTPLSAQPRSGAAFDGEGVPTVR